MNTKYLESSSGLFVGDVPLESEVEFDIKLEKEEFEDTEPDKKAVDDELSTPDIGQGSDKGRLVAFCLTSSWSKVTQFLVNCEAMFC